MPAYYPPPVDRLLTLGREPALRRVWPDYRHLGLEPRHVAPLISMACDEELFESPERDRSHWAPVHAWRALAQLGATTAVKPLFGLLERYWREAWVDAELPLVLGSLGPDSLPDATLLLFDEEKDDLRREQAIEIVVTVGLEYPERRDEVAAVLTRQLEDWKLQSPELNGQLVAALLDLQERAAAPLMEAAYAAGRVAPGAGDWVVAQVALGLLPESALDEMPFSAPSAPRAAGATRARKKAQKQARQRNRRR